jgi:DNA-binding NtrC family response regulator
MSEAKTHKELGSHDLPNGHHHAHPSPTAEQHPVIVPEHINQRVLVVEDNPDTRNSLQELLQLSLKLEVDSAEDGEKALEMLEGKKYSLVVTDLRMPRMKGMKLIEEIQKRQIPVTTIVTTGHGGIRDAVDAMRMGVYDFLTKPPDPQHLCLVVQRALQERALRDEVLELREKLQERHSFKNIISKNPRMLEIFELISHVADTATTVLIEGETGSGKEQLGRALHSASTATRPGPFVAINCAAVPETLLESELFGHEKGSFTGATTQRRGRFEMANMGTLFLDEVGDIPAGMQIKLLRVLQERKFERVGGAETIETDIRLVAASNQSLEKLVANGKFREDLYYRLNVIHIELPPLRERTEDIPLLAIHFCQKFARPGQTPCQISPAAMERLLAYSWPGNIRQLENAIEQACVTARDGIVQESNLPREVLRKDAVKTSMQVDLSRPLPEQLNDLTNAFEKRYLRLALKRTRGHVGRCARISGLSRRSITDKIAQYGIDKSEFKSEE